MIGTRMPHGIQEILDWASPFSWFAGTQRLYKEFPCRLSCQRRFYSERCWVFSAWVARSPHHSRLAVGPPRLGGGSMSLRNLPQGETLLWCWQQGVVNTTVWKFCWRTLRLFVASIITKFTRGKHGRLLLIFTSSTISKWSDCWWVKVRKSIPHHLLIPLKLQAAISSYPYEIIYSIWVAT